MSIKSQSSQQRKLDSTDLLFLYLFIFGLSLLSHIGLTYLVLWLGHGGGYLADTSAGLPWYAGSLIVTLVFSIAVLIFKQKASRNKLALWYTIAIILTTMVGPTIFVGAAWLSLSIYRLVWFALIWASIAVMWAFVLNRNGSGK